jgi:hypothetical protein
VLECYFEGFKKKLEVLIWLIVLEENRKWPFDLGCNAVKVKVVLKDEGAKENGVKVQVAQEYSLAHPRAKL